MVRFQRRFAQINIERVVEMRAETAVAILSQLEELPNHLRCLGSQPNIGLAFWNSLVSISIPGAAGHRVFFWNISPIVTII